MSGIYDTDESVRFAIAYHQSLSGDLQRVREIVDLQRRKLVAQESSLIVDYDLMVELWDPLACMSARKAYGYSWVPSAKQPNVTPPTSPPTPEGAITVSDNIADYPVLVNARMFGMYYQTGKTAVFNLQQATNNFFKLYSKLTQMGYMTQNNQSPTMHMIIPSNQDAIDTRPEDLGTLGDYHNSPSARIPGGMLHFGVVINMNGQAQVYDAEWLWEAGMRGGETAVTKMIGDRLMKGVF